MRPEAKLKECRATFLADSSDIKCITPFYHYKKNYMKDGVWHVVPIGIDRWSVYIICPYCGGVHLHGNNVGGFRSPHCHNLGVNYPDYYLDYEPDEKYADKK